MKDTITLFQDDFQDFPIGEFPYDREHSAIGEYHFYPADGYCGEWYDPVTNYNYTGPSWIITESHKKHYMEQMRLETNNPHTMHPMLVAGDVEWKDYTFQADVRLLNTLLEGEAGICFYYQNSLNLLAFVIKAHEICLLRRHKEQEITLKTVSWECNGDKYYRLGVICSQGMIRCLLDGTLIFNVQLSKEIPYHGKVALTANLPAQFTSVSVTTVSETAADIIVKRDKKNARLIQLQSHYPSMKLWKTLNLQNFGTGRHIRFGHLTGGSQWHIVLAQVQKRIQGDAYARISCLTAIDLNGAILWQIGEPSTVLSFGQLSADVPLQVYDIDGDGCDEVITSMDFRILILDGQTGKIKNSIQTPCSGEDNEQIVGIPFQKYAFDRINPDSIRIVNFSGSSRPSDILIKDRYCRLYAYNHNLELLWIYQTVKNTGHFPYAFDADGDGCDELFCGYDFLDHDGRLLWSLPLMEDHTDEIILGRFSPAQTEPYLALASGTQGFILADLNGHILKQDRIGHAQRISCGNYCPNLPGFELCVTNFWGHQGIIYLYDCEGEPLLEIENAMNGNLITPVNWMGDGSDLILTNACALKGGLLNGKGQLVVPFPDDGHPDLCAEAIDLTGDAREELVVWDNRQMYIYTQEDNPRTEVYIPVKYPHYNSSNYRGEYSFPDTSYLSRISDEF